MYLIFSILLVELEERRRGFKQLQAAYKALSGEFWTEEGPNYFDRWGRALKPVLLQINTLAGEVATAESITKGLADGPQEKVSH